jgi:hypothetical protein
MTFDEFTAARPDIFRLVPKKTGGLDGLFQLNQWRVRVVRRRVIFFEQFRRNDIDAFVGALRRKNGGDEQLKGVGVIQLAVHPGINPVERGDNPPQASGFGLECFAWHLRREFNNKGTKK